MRLSSTLVNPTEISSHKNADLSIDTELRDTQDLANTLCRAMRSRQRLIITDLERAYERFQRELAYVPQPPSRNHQY